METMGIKSTEEILRLSQQYGILNVVLILVLFFLGGLVVYVLKQSRQREIDQSKENARRDERWALLIEKIESRSNERHEANLKAMSILAEEDRRQREEHDAFIKEQRESNRQKELIVRILDKICLKLNIAEGAHP